MGTCSSNNFITIIPFDIYIKYPSSIPPTYYIKEVNCFSIMNGLKMNNLSVVHYFNDTSSLSSNRNSNCGFICTGDLYFGRASLCLVLNCRKNDILMDKITPILHMSNKNDLVIDSKYLTMTRLSGKLSYRRYVYRKDIDLRKIKNPVNKDSFVNIIGCHPEGDIVNRWMTDFIKLFHGLIGMPNIEQITGKIPYLLCDKKEYDKYVSSIHPITIIHNDDITDLDKNLIRDKIVKKFGYEFIRDKILFSTMDELLCEIFDKPKSTRYYASFIKTLTPDIYANYLKMLPQKDSVNKKTLELENVVETHPTPSAPPLKCIDDTDDTDDTHPTPSAPLLECIDTDDTDDLTTNMPS